MIYEKAKGPGNCTALSSTSYLHPTMNEYFSSFMKLCSGIRNEILGYEMLILGDSEGVIP